MRWLLAFFVAFPLTTAQAVVITQVESFNGPGGAGTPQYTTVYNECFWKPFEEWNNTWPGSDNSYWEQAACDYHEFQIPKYGYPDIGRWYEPQTWVFFDRPVTVHSVDTTDETRLRSSRGGEISVSGPNYCPPPVYEYDYDPNCVVTSATEITDPLFRNVTWITICGECGWWYESSFYDNIRFSYPVNEPPPLWLLLTVPIIGLLIHKQERKMTNYRPGA